MSQVSIWAIRVSGYGSFLFSGTEAEAEEMRVHKARWEQGVARKRKATPSEIAANKASDDVETYCARSAAETKEQGRAE